MVDFIVSKWRKESNPFIFDYLLDLNKCLSRNILQYQYKFDFVTAKKKPAKDEDKKQRAEANI